MSHLRGIDLLAIACGVLCTLGYVGAVIAWIMRGRTHRSRYVRGGSGMTVRKLGDLTPFHHLRIVEKVYGKSVGPESTPEKTGIVATNIYLDDKELHGPIENELRVVYGPDQLTVAYVPVVVASITVEREVVDNEPEGEAIDAPEPGGDSSE